MDPVAIGTKIKQLYPQYANADASLLGQKYLQKYGGAVNAVKSGQLKTTDLPAESQVGATIGLEATGYKPKDAAGQKQDQSLNATVNLINSLEKSYSGAGGATGGNGILSRILGAGKTISGKLGNNDQATNYNDSKAGFAATLKSLTGDTGVLTDQDYARLSKLLPSLGSTPGEAKSKFSQLRDQIAAKYGGKSSATTINPQESGGAKMIDNVFGAVKDALTLKSSRNVANDIGAGISANMSAGARGQANTEAFSTAKQVQDLAATEKDPKKKKQLLLQANDILRGVSKSEGQVADTFSKDVQRNPLLRGVTAGSEIAGAASLASGVPKVASGGKKILSTILQPAKVIGNYRTAEIKAAEAAGKTINGNAILTHLENAANDVPPTAKASYDKFLKTAQTLYKDKELSIGQGVKLNSAANDVFTSAGRVGKAATAKFNKELSDVIKEQIKTQAPNVAKANKYFKTLYGVQKSGKFVGGAAATGATYALLSKILGPLGLAQKQ